MSNNDVQNITHKTEIKYDTNLTFQTQIPFHGTLTPNY
jgi:hypothetical protein